MLSTLCEHLVPRFPALAGHKAVIAGLRSAQKERNKFAHHSLGPGKTEGDIVMAIGSARGSLKTSVEKISIADIRRAVMAIDEAFVGLYKLVLGGNIEPAWKRRQKADPP